VQAKDVPGFIVNRMARPFYLEALRLLEEGVADHATLDKLIRDGGGFRMGPFELMDLIGLDINYAASISVYESYFHEPRYRPSLAQQRMVESGRLGRKTGRGWYEYDEK
jgi:3-hydroxybutyryl-CoA dehydrogenase